MSISEPGLTRGNINCVEESAPAAPSPQLEKSPANQNPCSPETALVTCTQPVVVAPGESSLASLASCPRGVMVCDDVPRELPPASKSVKVTLALADPGFTMANPVVLKSCGRMMRAKLSVDCP